MKMIKFIARTLLTSCNLPTRCWGHNMLHAANSLTLDRRPTTSILSCMLRGDRHRKFPTFTGSVARCMYRYHHPSNRQWACSVSQRYTLVMRLMSIVTYLDPMTCDCHTARIADLHFDEDLFPTLGGGNQPLDDKSREITWQATGIHASDPRTAEMNK